MDELYPPPGYSFPFSYESDPKHYKITILDKNHWQLKVPYVHNILSGEKIPEGVIKVRYPQYKLPKARSGFDNPAALVDYINSTFEIDYGIEQYVRTMYVDDVLDRKHEPHTTVIISEKTQKTHDESQRLREEAISRQYSDIADEGNTHVQSLEDAADVVGDIVDDAETKVKEGAEAVKDEIKGDLDAIKDDYGAAIISQEVFLIAGLGIVAFIVAKVL